VGVVGQEGPGVDGEGARFRQRRETRDEIRAVGIIPEKSATLDPPHHHVMEAVGRRFRTKSGIEDSGRRAESKIPDEERKASKRAWRGMDEIIPLVALFANVPHSSPITTTVRLRSLVETATAVLPKRYGSQWLVST
jgi:hypothetical protein